MVIQTIIWMCEKCNYMVSETKEEFPYSDPTIPDQPGWGYIRNADGKKIHVCKKCKND